MIRTVLVLSVSLVALGGQSVRADEVKRSLFVLGIHMGGAEFVATSSAGDPPRDKSAAIGLIKRNLKWSIDVADVLKVPSAGLKSLLADVDRISFAAMVTRFGDLRLAMAADVSKIINPGAGAFFNMGVHEIGAEDVALSMRDFRREDKPGANGLIDRQIARMIDGTATIKVSLPPLMKILENMGKGDSFASLADQFARLRLAWEKELGAQPGFGGAGGGVVILSQAGKLTKADPKDRVRTDMHSKVFNVTLRAGVEYVIDLESGDGREGPHNPGFVDLWLRVEDAAGKMVAENDDFGGTLNAQVEFRPATAGTYRLVVTTFRPDATGDFTLRVREK